MKITFVFNNINWPSIAAKLAAVKEFFEMDFDLEITEVHTDFKSIPWVQTGAIGDVTNTPGTTQTVPPDWFDKNVSSKTPGADIVVFCLAPGDVPLHMTSVAIMQGKYGDIVQCCMFGINETDDAYINQVRQANTFVLFAEHEISHALYLLQRIPDNTHTYFYTGRPTKVLEDLNKGYLTGLALLLAKCKQLVLLLQSQFKTVMVQTNLPVPPGPQPVPQSIITWANAIKSQEGAKPELNNPGNLKVSSLTASWGATNGFQATDGGWIAKFETYDKGFYALCNFLILGCKDELIAFHQARTLEKFTNVYAGGPPPQYASNVANALGVSKYIDIATLL